MTSMSQSLVNLPSVTYHIPTKLTTIFLNHQQIQAIQHPAQHKLLLAPFGGGKTVILAEIAKKLLKVYIILCLLYFQRENLLMTSPFLYYYI